MSDDPKTRLYENATEVATVVVTGAWVAALVSGQGWWLGALLFGYIVVIPLVALLFGDDEERREWWEDDWFGWGSEEPSDSSDEEFAGDSDPTPAEGRDALETLRDRYAAGDLTDAQFEHKLERLLETEMLEDVAQRPRAAESTPNTVRREQNRERTIDFER
jgi:uncharacterized membrane protein